MRPMMRLVVGLAALGGILAAVAVGLPAHVTVARSVVTNAPESAVYPYLTNLHHFKEWSPWAARDPQLQLTYSGPDSGKGARVDWVSDVRSIGTGSMEITNADPNKTIELTVNFNGLDGTSGFDISPSGSGSKVTWTFGYDSGSSPLKRWKALALDGFVGAEYRAGLDKLKARMDEERRPTAPAAGLVPQAAPGSVQSEQPSAALPAGTPGTPGASGAATSGGTTSVAPTPASGAPAGTAQASGTQAAQPTADAATPVAPPAPQPPKKKRRRQQ